MTHEKVLLLLREKIDELFDKWGNPTQDDQDHLYLLGRFHGLEGLLLALEPTPETSRYLNQVLARRQDTTRARATTGIAPSQEVNDEQG